MILPGDWQRRAVAEATKAIYDGWSLTKEDDTSEQAEIEAYAEAVVIAIYEGILADPNPLLADLALAGVLSEEQDSPYHPGLNDHPRRRYVSGWRETGSL